jgi:1,2-phenylacetyl-CoA epoxidase catalytic subunit
MARPAKKLAPARKAARKQNKPNKPAGYAKREQMPQRYREMLEQMMLSQAYRELAAAHMFANALVHVPSVKWIKFMSWHIREEVDHYAAVAKMYESFTGDDVEPKVRARLAEKPVPFVDSWFELAMAQFLYDRGGFWQLQEYDDCSFPPYRDVVKKIVKEEKGHQELGGRMVVDLCRSGKFDDVKQPLFERWLRLGLLSFGRPGSEGAGYAIEVGLKKRDPALVMQDFLDDIKGEVRDSGLVFPKPETLKMELPATLDWSL